MYVFPSFPLCSWNCGAPDAIAGGIDVVVVDAGSDHDCVETCGGVVYFEFELSALGRLAVGVSTGSSSSVSATPNPDLPFRFLLTEPDFLVDSSVSFPPRSES